MVPGVGWRASPGSRLADALETLAARLWPGSLQRCTGWLLLLPALPLVSLVVAALVWIADFSLRELDPDTVAALFALLGAGTMRFLRRRSG